KMDSLERSRERDMEQRFEMVMRIVKRHTGDQLPEIEQKAQQIYLAHSQDLDSLDAAMGSTALADNSKVTKTPGEAERPEGGSYHGWAFKPIETYINLSGVEKGHYLVANVFKEEANVRNFMETLKEQGIATQYFKNPENGLNYVYLAKYQDNREAYEAYWSKMEGQYQEELWIMHVDSPRYSNWADTQFHD